MWELFDRALKLPYVIPIVFWGSVVGYPVLQCYMLFRDCAFLARLFAALPLLVTVPWLLLASAQEHGLMGPYAFATTIVVWGGAALYLGALWAFPRVVEWLVNRFL